MIKHAVYEAFLPESEKERAEMWARSALEKVIARVSTAVLSRSDMTYAFENGHHRFLVELDVAEAV